MKVKVILVAICLAAALLLRSSLMNWLSLFAATMDDSGPYSVNTLVYADVVLLVVLHAVAAGLIASFTGSAGPRLLLTALLATGASFAAYHAVVYVIASRPLEVWRAFGSGVGSALLLFGWSCLTVLFARITARMQHP